MEVVINIGTDEQKGFIKSEIDFMIKALRPLVDSIKLSKVIVPDNFEESIKINNPADSFQETDCNTGIYKVFTKNSTFYIFNPLLYTLGFSGEIRFYMFIQACYYTDNQRLFSTIDSGDTKKSGLLLSINQYYNEYHSRRYALKLLEQGSKELSSTFKEWLQYISEGYKTCLDKNNTEYKKLRNLIILYKYNQISFDDFWKIFRPQMNDVIRNTVIYFSYIDSNIIKNSISKSNFYNEKTIELLDYFRLKFNDHSYDLIDGIENIEKYLSNFGILLESRDNGIYYSVDFIHITEETINYYNDKIPATDSSIIKVYLDHQIYEDIRSNRIPEIIPQFHNKLKKLKEQNKISIFYSVYNIFETSKRSNEDHIYDELIFIQELTEYNFLDEKSNPMLKDPIELYFGLKKTKKIVDISMEIGILWNKLFIPENVQYNMFDFGFDPMKLNDIKPEKIKAELRKVADKNKELFIDEEKWTGYMEKLKEHLALNSSQIKEEILKKHDELFNLAIPESEGRESLIWLAKTSISSSIDKGIENVINVKFKDKDDWIDTIFAPDWIDTVLPKDSPFLKNASAYTIALADAFNYNYDKKSNKKKTLFEQQFDSLHFDYGTKCDIFITRDEKLYKKAKFATFNNNLKTMVFNIQEFLDYDF